STRLLLLFFTAASAPRTKSACCDGATGSHEVYRLGTSSSPNPLGNPAPNQALLRNSSDCGFTSSARALVAEPGSFLLQILQLAFAEAFVVFCCSDIMGRHVVLQHVIHGTGNVMGCRHQRLRWAEAPC